MCLRCEGWTADEVNALLDEEVRSSGWTTMGVDGRSGQSTWGYTIGLALIGHPELVLATVAPERAVEVLGELAERVVAGERLDTADRTVLLEGLTVTLRDIAPVHLERGLLAGAKSYYEWAGRPMPVLPARQVVLPDSEFCRCHAGAQPRLHLAHVSFGAAGPKRVERRRTARRRGRPR